MICSIEIKLSTEIMGNRFDIEKLRLKLRPIENWDWGKIKPIGCIYNMKVFWHGNELKIEGSLAKYYNKNNIENFDWRHIKPAIKLLSCELDLPIEKGTISRIDVGVNIALNHIVKEYFVELFHLENYQRIDKEKTTLRFENNSNKHNLIFYDKIEEYKSRNKKN